MAESRPDRDGFLSAGVGDHGGALRQESLVSIPRLVQRRDDADQAIADAVAAAREGRATWTEIGTALGCTRQAAQQRYRRLVITVQVTP